jgi:hypothetical protein
MRSLLANKAVLAGLLVPLCLYAQPRGAVRSFAGSRASFGGFRTTAPRIPRTPKPTTASKYSYSFPYNYPFPPVTGSSLINPGEASCILNPSFSGSFYCRQYFPGRPAFGAEPIFPSWFPSTGYQSEEEPAAPAPEAQPDALTAQVGNLAAEVARMREDELARQSQAAPATLPAAPEQKPPLTVFVYRDGREMEVQDYAILGDTLWVFSDQTTHRVPLSDLDLPKTQQLNADRGVDFVQPKSQ